MNHEQDFVKVFWVVTSPAKPLPSLRRALHDHASLPEAGEARRQCHFKGRRPNSIWSLTGMTIKSSFPGFMASEFSGPGIPMFLKKAL